LHPPTVNQLVASRLAARPPLGTLVAAMLWQLAHESHQLTQPDAIRLGPTIADMVSTLLGSALDARGDRSQAAVLNQIQSFIDQWLTDPTLAPSLVAAAHHIAPRSLNRIFARHGLTVTGWIRHRRLERCRQELADPEATRPIYSLALRYGFSDTAHFFRAFKAAYGVPPNTYRQLFRKSTTSAAPTFTDE
jgi:AraC-like DNA-binding protein